MLLTRYQPFNEFRDITSRFNTLLSGLNEESDCFRPIVNTREGEFAYHIDVDLPGVKKEDIKIDVTGNRLTMTGERHHKKELKEKDYRRIESSFGKFERSFTLPDDADVENITAANKDGVLEVIIPKLKTEPKGIKQIPVK
ncbi:MAG: Hsp20/alpha crystallin family protein [Campylobacterales bacterium]|nr:Hsp20/alpha crystallin family protein [Campylobacterales bacterium]